MEEENLNLNEGQENVVDSPIDNTQETTQVPEEGATEQQTAEVAEEQISQAPETNHAFAELRRQAQQYERELKQRDEWVSKTFGQHGITTWEQYQQVMEEQLKAQQEEELRQKGVDPNLVNELIEKNPEVQKAREYIKQTEMEKQFTNEANKLFESFPDLKPQDIPNEVLEIREKEGIPLLHAYRSYMFDHVKQQTEKATIQKLKANATNSPGALSGETAEHNTSISKMNKSDFNDLVQRVLRGEKVDL